jgi:hypothetical protein
VRGLTPGFFRSSKSTADGPGRSRDRAGRDRADDHRAGTGTSGNHNDIGPLGASLRVVLSAAGPDRPADAAAADPPVGAASMSRRSECPPPTLPGIPSSIAFSTNAPFPLFQERRPVRRRHGARSLDHVTGRASSALLPMRVEKRAAGGGRRSRGADIQSSAILPCGNDHKFAAPARPLCGWRLPRYWYSHELTLRNSGPIPRASLDGEP